MARPLHTVQCLAVTSTGASTALRGGRLPLLEPLLQQGHATAPLDLAATGNPSPKLHARVHSWSQASGSTCTSCKLLQANQQFPLYGTTALANPPIPKSWSLPPPPNTHTLTGHGHRREQQRRFSRGRDICRVRRECRGDGRLTRRMRAVHTPWCRMVQGPGAVGARHSASTCRGRSQGLWGTRGGGGGTRFRV